MKRLLQLVLLLLAAATLAHAQGSVQLIDGSGHPVYVTSNALNVDCVAGCSGGGGGGGTSSNFGAAFPTAGTAVGVEYGGNMVNLNADSSGYLYVDCPGCTGIAPFEDNAAFTAGTTGINITGGWYSTSTTACTSGHACAPQLTSDRKLYTFDFQGTSPWVVSLTSTTITGTVAVTQSTSPWVVSNGGTFAVQAAQSGTWTNTVTQATAANLNATVVFPSAQPVTLTSTTITGTVAVTQSTSPWIVAGGGTAGTPGTAVLAVQGVSGGTAVPVSGTFYQTTQPVSCTAANCAINLADLNAVALGSPSNYGTSPGAVEVQGVNAYVTNTVAVTGTFFQATQPVSCANAATCPVNASQVGGPWTQNVTQWDSVALGSPSNYGTSPGAVEVPGVNAYVTNTPAVTGSGVFEVAPTTAANTASNQFFTQIVDGTRSAVVTAGSASPASASAGLTVDQSPNTVGCAGQSLANTSSVAISTSSSSEVQLVAGSSGKSIYVCHFDFIATTAVTVTLQQASSGTCTTLTSMTGAYPVGANGGISSGNGQGVLFTVASGDQLCLLLGSGVATAGIVTYAQVAAP